MFSRANNINNIFLLLNVYTPLKSKVNMSIEIGGVNTTLEIDGINITLEIKMVNTTLEIEGVNITQEIKGVNITLEIEGVKGWFSLTNLNTFGNPGFIFGESEWNFA